MKAIIKTKDLTEQLTQLDLKHETVIDMLTAHAQKLEDQNTALLRWKAEALTVLNSWEEVWEAAGKPGHLGSSKATCTREYILSKTP